MDTFATITEWRLNSSANCINALADGLDLFKCLASPGLQSLQDLGEMS